ncbi:MAG TPA: ChbG/HpnK family deacetylase [Planctomycetota bacterium]|nr:ChbG/HpnK family deacetylase [Planctomycetota bacterium]
MPAVRRVVFVADDLGISPGVNDGIARAAATGLVREASVCVCGHAVAAGVQRARELGIGMGLHLCFTLGRPLSGPIRGLCDAGGNFRDLPAVLLACLRRAVDAAAVAREVAAQIALLRDLGVVPTHLNGHHHVHCLPVIRDAAFAAAARAGIRWTRLPAEHAVAGSRLRPERLLLAWLSRRARRLCAAAGLRALPFVGFTLQARADYGERVRALAARLPAGDYEWMVHPRVPDAEFAALDPRGGARDAAANSELAALADAGLPAALTRLGVVPAGYAQVG